LVTARALWREFHRYVSFSRDSLGAAAFVAHAGGDLRLESGDADVGGTEAGPHPGIPVNHRRRRGGVSKVSGTFKGTILATFRIAATFFRVAFSNDRNHSTVSQTG